MGSNKIKLLGGEKVRVTKEKVEKLQRMLLNNHYRKTDLVREIIEDKKLSNKEE